MAGHLIHRLAGLAVAASAAIFASGAGREPAALIVSVAMIASWAAMNLTSSGWMSWMADLIPESSRGSFFLRRSAVFQGVTVVWFFLASVLLDLFPDESRSWAYVLIFGVGAVGGSARHPPPPAHPRARARRKAPLRLGRLPSPAAGRELYALCDFDRDRPARAEPRRPPSRPPT